MCPDNGVGGCFQRTENLLLIGERNTRAMSARPCIRCSVAIAQVLERKVSQPRPANHLACLWVGWRLPARWDDQRHVSVLGFCADREGLEGHEALLRACTLWGLAKGDR